jgi:hypothetical protein
MATAAISRARASGWLPSTILMSSWPSRRSGRYDGAAPSGSYRQLPANSSQTRRRLPSTTRSCGWLLRSTRTSATTTAGHLPRRCSSSSRARTRST